MSTPELYMPVEYVQALIHDIRSAKRRVILFSHIIGYDSSTKELVEELCDAAKRGVQVDVAGDVFTYGILGGWKVVSLKPNLRIRALRTMIQKFKISGVRYRWIGQFGPFLFAGRTHVKWCVIDDRVYGFGGVNLYAPGLKHTDYMLGGQDGKLGDRIAEEHARIAQADKLGKFYRSRRFDSSSGTVLIDGGRMGDSIIYQRACELAEQASSVVFVSQYCPTGRLGKIMREGKAKLYFSDWRIADGLNRLLIRSSMTFTGYETLYKRPRFIHAKCILYTMPDGTRTALTGSHNFIRGSVVLGTREIALETSDKRIIAELEEFLEEHIY